jgi:hypothetical protein
MRQVCIDTIHKVSYDSLTVSLLKDSQKFYSDSFYWLIGILTLAIAILAFFNIKQEKDINKKVSDSETKLSEKIKAQIKEQETEFSNKIEIQKTEFKKQLEEILKNDRKNIKLNYDNTIREIGRICFAMAAKDIEVASQKYDKNRNNLDEWLLNIVTHFSYLTLYYSFFNKYSIELNNDELSNLSAYDNLFLGIYKKLGIEALNEGKGFLKSFYNFKHYCRSTNKKEHYEKAEAILKELCKVFNFKLEDIL